MPIKPLHTARLNRTKQNIISEKPHTIENEKGKYLLQNIYFLPSIFIIQFIDPRKPY